MTKAAQHRTVDRIGRVLLTICVSLFAQPAFTASGSLLDAARAEQPGGSQFELWIDAMEAEPRLRRTLEGSGTFTLFLPNDEAFRQLYELDACGAIQLNEQLLSTLINYHVVRGLAETPGPGDQRSVRTRLGAPITIASEVIRDGSGSAASIDGPAIEAANGVAHVIDKVLWPYPAPACS